jgi:hypothetical protein
MALISRAGLQTFFNRAGIAALLLIALKYAVPDRDVRYQAVTESLYTAAEDTFSRFAEQEPASAKRVSFKKTEGNSRLADRKSNSETPSMIVKTADLSLLAKSPIQEMTRIEIAVRDAGGLVLSSSVEKRSSSTDSVRMVLRIPVAKLDDLRATIKQGIVSVDRDSVEARDVTKEYVDSSARLANLQAEERQYREIMKQARNVEDTLRVTDKLSEVRGEIEVMQGTLNFLKNQAEMSTVQVAIMAEADAVVAGVKWRPLYQAKMAMANGLEGLSDYANTMFVILFRIPAILLWLFTLVIFSVVSWRIALWVWGRLRSLVLPVQGRKVA